MRIRSLSVLGIALVASTVAALEPPQNSSPAVQNAPAARRADFARLKSLTGDWIDISGSSAGKGRLAARYHVTSGGTVVQETLFPGTSHEMVSMYTEVNGDILMSHYCAMGNQPRMRARAADGDTLQFAFDGGIADPEREMHMHEGLIRFEGGDRLHAEWQTWEKGAAGEHKAEFTLRRRSEGE